MPAQRVAQDGSTPRGMTDDELINLPLPAERRGRPRVASYAYQAADGTLRLVVHRFADKSFSQHAISEDGSTLMPRRGEVEPVLYRLPAVLAAVRDGRTIYLVEGEKDVLSAERAGVTATCNPGGAGKLDTSLLEPLRGADVVVVWDRDEAGRGHGLKARTLLSGVANRVRMARAAVGKDLADHLDAGLTIADLEFRRPKRPRTATQDGRSSGRSRVAAEGDDAIPSILRRALGQLEGVQQKGPDSWTARCPAPDHEDRNPSFSIGRGSKRPIVVWCHSRQCSIAEIARGLGLDASDLSTERRPKTSFTATPISAIAEAEVRWLWPGRIPFGKLTVLDGDPQLGKSLITVAIAACLSTGRPLPGAEGQREPSHVLFICAEDDPGDTIRPRLVAAQADLQRVHVLDEPATPGGQVTSFVLPDHLLQLEKLIVELDVGLVVIDPITAFLSAQVNSHSDASVRSALTPLKGLAQRTGAAVVLVRHLNKSGDQSAIYRGGGSIAFTAAARSALMVGRHPSDPDARVLAVSKANLCASPPSLGYRIEASTTGAPVLRWLDEVDVAADDLVAKPDRSSSARELEAAQRFLAGFLADGEKTAGETIKAAKELGFSESTLKRARRDLVGSRTEKDRSGKVTRHLWHLLGESNDQEVRS